MNKPLTGREAEEPCKNAYDSYLRTSYPSSDITWEKNLQDPPDYWLSLNRKRYAVEVTTLMDRIGVEDRTPRDLYHSIGRFTASVQTELNNLQPFAGGLRVDLKNFLPTEGQHYRKLRKELVSVLKAICLNNYERRVTLLHRQICWATAKINASQQTPLEFRLPAFAGYPSVEAPKNLLRAVTSKTRKLEKAGAQPPWILLLWVDSFIALPRHYLEITTHEPHLKRFAAIFAASPTGFAARIYPPPFLDSGNCL